MALIDNTIRLKRDRPMSESEWTLELIRLGEAEWSESEKRWRAQSLENSGAAVVQASSTSGEASGEGNEPVRLAPDTPSQSLDSPTAEAPTARDARVRSAGVSQSRRPVQTPERRHSLTDMSLRLTGKRTRRNA
jgi:hypothetical protein